MKEKQEKVTVTMSSELRAHLEALASLQSSLDGRSVSMAEICRKLIQKGSGFHTHRYTVAPVAPVEVVTEAKAEDDKMRKLFAMWVKERCH